MGNVGFNELPLYSSQIKDILYQKKIHKKTESEVLREFDNEKWKKILLETKEKDSICFEDVMYAEIERKFKTVYFQKKKDLFMILLKKF